jgi:hypothetical protein
MPKAKTMLLAVGAMSVFVLSAATAADQAVAVDVESIKIQRFDTADLVIVPDTQPKKPACDIIAQIDAFRSEMASISLNVGEKDIRYTETRANTVRTFREPETQIALGLLNLTTCERRVVTITKHGDKLTNVPSGYDIEVATRANGISWNYWNTTYKVNSPSGWFVAADVYPIKETQTVQKTVKLKNGKTKQVATSVKVVVPIFYVPFSEEMDRPEFVQMGQDYLLNLSRNALDALRRRGVMSRAYPGTLIADTAIARPEWLARIAPMEHTDMTELVLDPDWTFSRIFTQIGLNRGDFATHTCSKAAACGLMQITDNSTRDAKGRIQYGTYTSLRLAYAAAGLNKDYLAGARDPLNAMMLAYLHNDDILYKLMKTFGGSITDDSGQLEELVFAGYNGGDHYITQALQAKIKKKLADWTTALPSCRRWQKNGCLPAETRDYIAAKLRYLRDQWPVRQLTQAVKTPDL